MTTETEDETEKSEEERDLTAAGTIYAVAGETPYQIACINGESQKSEVQFDLKDNTIDVALRPDGKELWCIPSSYEMTFSASMDMEFTFTELPITIINPKTGEVIDTIDCPYVGKAAFSPDGKKVYLCMSRGNEVAVYDVETREKLNTIKTGKYPSNISVSFDGKKSLCRSRSQLCG